MTYDLELFKELNKLNISKVKIKNGKIYEQLELNLIQVSKF